MKSMLSVSFKSIKRKHASYSKDSCLKINSGDKGTNFTFSFLKGQTMFYEVINNETIKFCLHRINITFTHLFFFWQSYAIIVTTIYKKQLVHNILVRSNFERSFYILLFCYQQLGNFLLHSDHCTPDLNSL